MSPTRLAPLAIFASLILLTALDGGTARAQTRPPERPLPIYVDHARIADLALLAARALEADHAKESDHALRADRATEAGHALTADVAANANHATTADTAANANHATTADTAATANHAATADEADTLSPGICQPGEILQKGEQGWQCARVAGVPFFVGIPLGDNETKFAFANLMNGVVAPTNPAIARPFSEFPLPRGGVVSNLFVRSARPMAPGFVVTVTLVVNGVDTALTVVTTTTATPALASNTMDRVPVQPGDLVTLKATAMGGTCAANTATCPYLAVSVLLE
jgi:hypothetical protein